MAEITHSEFRSRRDALLESLRGSVGLVLAGEGAAPLRGQWHANPHFLYLTGIHDEPGAAVLFDPAAEDPKRRAILFLRPINPELDRWDSGVRDEISAALRVRTGFDTVMRTIALPRFLTDAVRRAKRASCLHTPAVYDAPVSPDLALLRKVAERVPGVSIDDRSQLLHQMRAVKSDAEVALIRRAIDGTAAAFRAAASTLRPGVRESEVQAAMEKAWLAEGCRGPAYNPIVGSGFNGTVLHYNTNRETCRAGDLVVIDAGAEFAPAGLPGAAYAADVTRTLPVSGRFTPDQRDIYEVVLRALAAAIKTARPGARMLRDVDAAARAVIDKAGYGDAFIHGIGHHLGLEVHDATPDGPLKPGMVVTLEPGIYLPAQRLGIRIEDDALITRGGNEVLTAMIPKSVREIEAAMARPGIRRNAPHTSRRARSHKRRRA